MRFDWYGATVPAPPAEIVGSILNRLTEVSAHPVAGLTSERRKGAKNYEHSDVITDGLGQTVCMVFHGGSNGAPHVCGGGVYIQDVATLLRALYPRHAVSRADCCVDFDGPGTWSTLFNALYGFSKERPGIRWKTYGDFRDNRDPMSGRTVYLGSRQSAVFVRLYEKGLEQVAKRRSGEEPISLDWCRLEVEVKPPTREGRHALASVQPEGLWGCSPWTRALIARVCNLGVERTMMTTRKETETLRKIRAMAYQYRNSLDAAAAELGGDQALMRFIRQVHADMDRERPHRRAA